MNRKEKIISFIIISVFLVILIIIAIINLPRNENNELSIYDEIGEQQLDDNNAEYNIETATKIILESNSITTQGNGVSVEGSIATITQSGVYYITGNLSDGRIVVNANSTANIQLILDNVDIYSSNKPAIYVTKASKVIVTLAKDSKNILSDGENYILDDVDKQEPDATLFSKADLVINGTGTLEITANYKDGIASKDGLRMVSGNIDISAKDNGIRAKDYVQIDNGNITIDCEGDGIKVTEDSDSTKGYFNIDNGTLNITATQDGIQAQTNLVINNGNISIKTGASSNSTSSDISSKGVKGVLNVQIYGGTITIDALDDAIHSNGNVNIYGGEITISTSDDGIHADNSLSINNGYINILKSYEGLESKVITIQDGTIKVISTDDGINVSDSTTTNQPGKITTNSNVSLVINGGYVLVNSSGDGLDSNGSIYMNGGTVLVNGPTNSGNGALDYDGEFVMTGGTLVAVGSSGMAQSISNNSSVNAVMINFSTKQSPNSIINIQDSTNTQVITYAPSKEYQSVVIATPILEKGKTYDIYTGGNYSLSNQDGYYKNGTYSDGNKVYSFTISSVITTLGNSSISNGMPNMRR